MIKRSVFACFGNSIYIEVFYALLDYRPRSGKDDIEAGSIMQPELLDACVATVSTCYEHNDTHDKHK